MRRVAVVSLAIAMLLGVTAGIAVATDVGWTGRVVGEVVATDSGHDGLSVGFRAVARPTDESFSRAHGSGYYDFNGNAFHVRVTHMCVSESEGTASVWGPVKVKSGSFSGGELVKGDSGYGVLSLLDNGDGIVSARAAIAVEFFPTIPDVIAVNCEHSPTFPAPFPATGLGELNLISK